jgi:hypothetical protein
MDRALIDRIARAVLYEGYVLYPYRRSSLKNARRWTFGILYPEAAVEGGSDRASFQTECLLIGPETARLSVLLRFLHLVGAGAEAIEREVSIETAVGEERREAFDFHGPDLEPVGGEIAIRTAAAAPGALKITVTVRNTAEFSVSDRLLQSLASAHVVLAVEGGEFVSMTDPPQWLSEAASQCVNAGVWPVLIGEPGSRDTVLASPIVLPDYPQVAPESTGDLYDATEIEEILTLRVLTLTDEEKAEVRTSEDRARAILERAEALPAEHLMRLHGTIRGLVPAASEPWSAWDSWANSAPVEAIHVGGAELRAGARVVLRPRRRADIFDSALDGRIAVIEAIEQDFESNIQLAVVLEDDPGRDLGEMRQAGHRFFFKPDEVEPLVDPLRQAVPPAKSGASL